MTQPTKTEAPKPPISPFAGGKTPESLPVSVIIWKRMNRIPGDHSSESVESGNGPGKHYKLAWLPRLQVFEVTLFQAHGLAPEVGYVHVSNAQHWKLLG